MKIGLFGAVLGAATLAASFGFGEAQTVGGGGKEARYTLTIRAKQPEYKVGTPILIEVMVKNVSTSGLEGLGMEESAADLFFTAEVRDDKGVSVPETQFERDVRAGEALWVGGSSAPVGGPPWLLQPGKSRTLKIDLIRRFDLSQPGRYVVQVQRQNDKSAAKVKSNQITITIAN